MCLVLMTCLYCGVHIGTAEDVDRFSRRTVRVTREHNAECQRLLRLMGIPVVVVRPPTSTIFIYRANNRCCPFSVTAGSIRSGGAVCRACTRREGAFRLIHLPFLVHFAQSSKHGSPALSQTDRISLHAPPNITL